MARKKARARQLSSRVRCPATRAQSRAQPAYRDRAQPRAQPHIARRTRTFRTGRFGKKAILVNNTVTAQAAVLVNQVAPRLNFIDLLVDARLQPLNGAMCVDEMHEMRQPDEMFPGHTV